MDIRNIKIEQSKYNIKLVNEIFDKIENQIKTSVGPLHMAVSEDNIEFSETQEYSNLINTINRAKEEDWIMKNNSKTLMYDGLGSIAAVTDDRSDVSLYLILKALKTHNNLVLFVNDKVHEVTKKLIEIVNKICKEDSYNTYIDYHEYKDFKEIYDYSDYFKTIVFVLEILEILEKDKFESVSFSLVLNLSISPNLK